MRTEVEPFLERWVKVQLIDVPTAERIRQYESGLGEGGRLRWPVLLAISLGGLMLSAGVVLFVAAHWEKLSPGERFSIVLGMVALFHVAGAFIADRFATLATVLHAVGTAALGAGIFLAGQIFNLQEHWPGGVMLWAMGAWIGWALRRDWVQAAFAAILTPWWLVGEWLVAVEHAGEYPLRVAAAGLVLLAFTYISARTEHHMTAIRQMLNWIGCIALLPSVGFLVAVVREPYIPQHPRGVPTAVSAVGWLSALFLPLFAAFVLRRRLAWMNCAAALWVLLLVWCHAPRPYMTGMEKLWFSVGVYILCAVGSLGLVAWGLAERRRERVDLGMAGFALTILFFYFAEVMDKLSRSLSLIGFGVLFLLVGWSLEKTRRKLVARTMGGGR